MGRASHSLKAYGVESLVAGSSPVRSSGILFERIHRWKSAIIVGHHIKCRKLIVASGRDYLIARIIMISVTSAELRIVILERLNWP